MNRETIKRNLQNCSLRDNEDLPVIDYISSIYNGQELTLLEIGSGECRFTKKINKLFPNIRITCIEINPELAKIAIDCGFEVLNQNILDVTSSREYDIVHCSHVIEHFPYPEVTQLLEFIVASTKVNMCFIIRTPLLWEQFYYDIDHIRPYSYESIWLYFNLKQQQKQGKATIELRSLWYRTLPKHIDHLQTWNLLYLLKPLRRLINKIIDKINRLYEFLWKRFRIPSSRPNGYVAIIRVIQK